MIETLREWLSNPVFTRWEDSLWQNSLVTLYMTFGTMLLTVLIGTPIGVLLHQSDHARSGPARIINSVVGFLVNVGRSFPFIILIIALIPVTRFIVGRATGPNAAMVALAVAAIPFLARLIEINLREVGQGKVEAVEMMGASRWQVIRQVLLPEALPGIIGSITTTTIAVVGYTAMAGAVGGKGLGDLAIRKGYNSYETEVMVATVIVLIVLVILVQAIGSRLANVVDHRARAH